MKFDFLIVGSGFYGSVLAERISKILNKTVLIIDKRSHIGGNCFSDFCKKTNIEYHKYGTHIFHTSNKKVMDYMSPFMKLNNYRHQVLTKHKNYVYQMPINLETINSLFKKNFSKTVPNIFFGGRLADYAYYDMDMTISAALQKFEKIRKTVLQNQNSKIGFIDT